MLCRKRFPGSSSACAGRSDGCGCFRRGHAAGWNHGAAAIVAVATAASVAMIAITTAVTAVAIVAAAAASIAAAIITTIPASAVMAAGIAIAAALDYLMNKNADSCTFQQLES